MSDASPLPPALVGLIRRRSRSPETVRFVTDTLRDIVDINTVPVVELAGTAAREQAVLERIAREAEPLLGPGGRIERTPVPGSIEKLPEYTFPSYARSEGEDVVPPAEVVYAGRWNLLAVVPGTDPDARGVAVNAHVDVVAPYFGFRQEGERLIGRGTVDDKGGCLSELVAIDLLAAARDELGIRPVRDVTFQFVLDEEIGGNGSLALAADASRDWECVYVCEGTSLLAHPANRGALWYRIDMDLPGAPGEAVPAAAELLLALREEGRRIKAESEHPLFPDRPVQTCNGVVGAWGAHPSRVCACVGLQVLPADGGEGDVEVVEGVVREACRRGVAEYCARYGDATDRPDPDDESRPMVLRHYDVLPHKDGVFVLIYGRSGHMGSIDDLDCAATKTAHVVAALREEAPELRVLLAGAPDAEAQEGPTGPEPAVPMGAPDVESGRRLTLEGGQGFVPTHDITEVQARIERAAEEARAAFCRERGLSDDAVRLRTTFERLHNNAYERDPDSRGMRVALAGRELAGLPPQEEVRGWKVSCDARLFADLRPDTDPITFGPGELSVAHSANEAVTAEELIRAGEALAFMLLLYGREEA